MQVSMQMTMTKNIGKSVKYVIFKTGAYFLLCILVGTAKYYLAYDFS